MPMPDDWRPGESIETRLERWAAQRPGFVVTDAERKFITALRAAATDGVGYGWMMQVIEWEWQSKARGSWGPEYFHALIKEMEASRPLPPPPES